jgi:hypothetical protein
MPRRLARLIGWIHSRLRVRRDPDADMAEEIRLHLEQRASEFVARGLTPEQARTAAHRQFGPVEPVKEACRDERRRARWFESLSRDVQSGLRILSASFHKSANVFRLY